MNFISIDGVDGSVKTTICSLLSSSLKYELIKLPRQTFFPTFRQEVNSHPEYVLCRFTYYLMANLDVSQNVLRNKFDAQESVILDRYIYSTLATHLALDQLYNGGLSRNQITTLFDTTIKTIIEPNVAIFLYTDEKIRLNRVKQRNSAQNFATDYDPRMAELSINEFKLLANNLRNSGKKVIEVDTSNMGPTEIKELILTQILVIENTN